MIYAQALTVASTALDGATVTLTVLKPSYVFDRAHTDVSDFDPADVIATATNTVEVVTGDTVLLRVTDDEFADIDLGGDTEIGGYALSVSGDLLVYFGIDEVEDMPVDPLTVVFDDGWLEWAEG